MLCLVCRWSKLPLSVLRNKSKQDESRSSRVSQSGRHGRSVRRRCGQPASHGADRVSVAAAEKTLRAIRPAGGTAPPQIHWHKAHVDSAGRAATFKWVSTKAKSSPLLVIDRRTSTRACCASKASCGSHPLRHDRLTQPLLRKGTEYVAITWEEAIDIIAQRHFKHSDSRSMARDNGQSRRLRRAETSEGRTANNHIDPNARLCMASAVAGFLATYGVDEPAGCYDDLDACDVLINWGNNPAGIHPVLFSRVIDRPSHGAIGRTHAARVIDIGTRRTRTSELATDFILLKPQGDVALALGLMNLLVTDRRHDAAFVERHCNFRAPQDTNPTLQGQAISFEDRAAIECLHARTRGRTQWRGPEKQRELADLFANRELRITSLWCMGMNQHTMGTAINTLVHGLHLLSGHFGRPGDAPAA